MLRKIFFLTVFIFALNISIPAQTETFDLTTFTPPTGWTKQIKNDVVMYVNTTPKGYCIIGVYQSKASNGEVKTDFKSEWKDLVVKPFQVTNPPTTEGIQENDGWKSLTGTATFENEAGTSAALLTTISGYGRTISILVILNNQDYMSTIESFLDSVKFTKPTANNSGNSEIFSPNQPASVSSGGASGISNATTNFDDGWVSTIDDEYVLVTKGEAKVYLFYPQPTVTGSPYSITEYFWNKVVVPRYNIQSGENLTPSLPDGQDWLYYYEGTGTDKKTGKSCFIGMSVVGGSSVYVIVGIAPNQQSFLAQIPTPGALSKMVTRNYFSLSPSDLVGQWKGGTGGGMFSYHGSTGAYNGVVMSTESYEFNFQANGVYQSRIVRATGGVGTTGGADVRSSGNFTASHWELSATGFQGKNAVFDAYFGAVKGGRMLFLKPKGGSVNDWLSLGKVR